MSEMNNTINERGCVTKHYTLTAKNDNCIYQTEKWSTLISSGCYVQYEVTLNCYSGTFEIEVTDDDYELLLNNEDDIIINNIPGAICVEVTNGWRYDECIVDKEKYTSSELKELHTLLYVDTENPDDEEVDIDTLEQNGWTMDDTIYSITNGVVLTI
uniref:Uncharacterized protein n=1 Tax=viral metagenome TaxID=1070528 RepID=A0A6C0BQ97_9ZZZZ